MYMAACPNGDCAALAAADLPALKWFAIYKEGLVNGKWATEMYMESNSNCVTHMIPETLAAGSYLIRHETIVRGPFLPGCGSGRMASTDLLGVCPEPCQARVLRQLRKRQGHR